MNAKPSPSNIATVADALLAARRDHSLADAASIGSLLGSADDAYAVQAQVASALGWFAGGAPRAWKSGGPSRDATLTHAPLPPAGVWASPARSGAWPLRLRGIEAEIALRLAQDVDASRAAAWRDGDAAGFIDAMTVSIEIVESRWRQQVDAPALAKLADLQSHGALVLGGWVPFAARDWAAQVCRVRIGDRAPLRAARHAFARRSRVRARPVAAPRHARRRHARSRNHRHDGHLVRHPASRRR